MNEMTLNQLHAYSIEARRQIHMYPEVGFELDKTVAYVSAELDKMGIAHTGKYGKCSLVADLGQGDTMIAIRTDMDALPVEEKVDLPFKSRHPGIMHACGHDSHTGILLAVARYFKEHEAQLPCKVRLVFQPSEEGQYSGAEMMVNNGVMDGVDHLVGYHCEPWFDAGFIATRKGDAMAACIPATIRFIGKSAHATLPEDGVHAVAMAVDAYVQMEKMVKEEAKDDIYIWSVGRFQGGFVHNVIPDLCEMDISFRFYNMDLADRVGKRVHEICDAVAASYGGKVEYDWHMSTGPVINDPELVRSFEQTVQRLGLPMCELPLKRSSEDLGWYLTKVPGFLFRFGIRNEATGCTAVAHRSDFCIDEEGMKNAIAAICEYIMSYQV